MDGRNQHIDQYFRQGLKGHTEQPTPDVWDALEKRLDDDRRKRGFAWWWFALFFLVATGFGVFYFNARTSAPPTAVPAHQPVPVPSSALTLTPALISEQSIIAKPKAQRKRTAITTAAVTPVIENEMTATNIAEPITETTALNIPAKEEPAPVKTTEAKKEDPDYSELKPFAGKNKTTVDAPISSEEYYALMPLAGKQATPIEKATSNAAPLAQNTPATAISPRAAPVAPELPAAKQETVAAAPATINTKAPVQIPDTTTVSRIKKDRFVAGLKSGYEFGTKPYHANSFVIAPYLQYYISKHVGIMLQPALKYSYSPSAVLVQGSYYRITDSSKTPFMAPDPGTGIPTWQNGQVIYSETYDSVVTSHTLAEIKFWNLDLPVMVCYKVNNRLEVYGGLNIHFTKVPQISMQTNKYTITRVDTITLNGNMSSLYDSPFISQVFQHTDPSQPYYNTGTGTGASPHSVKSAMANALAATSPFDNPLTNPFKMGVTFGASYNFKKRFQFEVLYRQNLSKMDYIPNEKVREIYKQPYFRLTLGYKFFK